MKLLRRLVGMLAILVVLVVGFSFWQIERSLPPEQHVTIEGDVHQPVNVFYDHRQRPFVFAESFADAFFVQGYLHAQHRLWQMEMFRRAGRGRLAEALGEAGLATDVELWRAGVPELAKRMQQVASSELSQLIRAYTAGVNAFLSNDPPLPPEFLLLRFEPSRWQAEDVFGLAALMAHQSANNLSQELLRVSLVEELGAEKASVFLPQGQTVVDPLQEAASQLQSAFRHVALARAETNPVFSAPSLGSNSWAVAGSVSASGNALFAFDSHDSISLPNLTYDVHLLVRGQQIRGTSVPGLLGVINGFNEFMAWGFTNIGDSQDAFLETSHPEDPRRFKDGEEWYRARVDTVDIPVRDASDHRLELVTTRNGRLINETPPIAVRWAPLEQHTMGLDALLKLNRATSYEEFNRALDEFVAPSANATYADVTGRIVQRTVGLLPVRAKGQGLIPLLATPENAWKEMIAMGELPRTDSPRLSYVAAANRPIASTPPLISADNAPGYRIQRIHSVLATLHEPTVRDLLDLQIDYTNLQARRLVPKMIGVLETGSLTEMEERALLALEAWGQAPSDLADEAGPLIFAAWYQELIHALFSRTLSEETFNRLLGNSYLLNHAIDNHLLAGHSGDWPIQAAVKTSFSQAVAQLARVYGQQHEWNWQAAHRLHLRHELGGAFPGAGWFFNRGPYPAAGGNATVGRARYSHRRPFNVSGGATTRMVLEMSSPIRAWMINPGGQSGHPASRWYNDQTASWLAGTADEVKIPTGDLPDLRVNPRGSTIRR